jgi:hypothetical protein
MLEITMEVLVERWEYYNTPYAPIEMVLVLNEGIVLAFGPKMMIIIRVLCHYWKLQWIFFKGWKYYNYLWTYNDGPYFSMKVLWHVLETIVKFCVTRVEGIAYRSGVFFILFQYFLATYLFYFFPYPPTSLNPMTFFKYSFTSILEVNGRKTQNLIIYKWADAHVQNVS